MTLRQKDRIRKWVIALRSGEYQQGKESLHPDGKFCCLGVACDLFLKAKKMTWEQNDFYIEKNLNDLPISVVHWFGLPDGNPLVSPTITAVMANDDRQWSFKKIATSIEKLYLKDS